MKKEWNWKLRNIRHCQHVNRQENLLILTVAKGHTLDLSIIKLCSLENYSKEDLIWGSILKLCAVE